MEQILINVQYWYRRHYPYKRMISKNWNFMQHGKIKAFQTKFLEGSIDSKKEQHVLAAKADNRLLETYFFMKPRLTYEMKV